ncbi:hypothetical protein F5Y04DRAFT_241475 [Hypomontagnella monticulosa]|nr:hypothetical protein F5Y04DRAFT_241475 [Hypomontagnella monticulosa]
MPTQSVADHTARFEESTNRTSDYPVNLIRTEAYHHTLESYRRRLNGKGIFDPNYRSLACIDLYENNVAFHKSKTLDTEEKLSGYIDEEDGAPLWRMVFLHSKSARGALGCSKEQLTILLTYYQVMPYFLDFILTFCTRERPVAHALFRNENYLEKNSPEFPLPELQRSGIQIQHAFNLLSVERASDPREKNQWPLRQVALYHSFDVSNGRCLWIILKGNTLMARRIFAAMEHQRRLKATDITSPETSFIAALQVQAIMIDWCSENWAEYIDHLEEVVSTNSAEGKTAPVDEVTSLTEIEHMHSPRSTNTFDTLSRAPSSPTSPRRRTFRQSSSDLFTVIRRLSGLENRAPTIGQDNADEAEAPAEVQKEEDDEHDRLSDLERDFSFHKFQRMSQLALELERALVVLEQNKGVLKAIEEHYRSVVDSYGFKANMKESACDSDLAAFSAKIRSIERDLDMHYRRLQTLSRALENDKAVFTTLLQYKSEKVSEYFASSAKTSSERMEFMTVKMHDIAVRTEQETVSMHVITIFTLIFLPGTFIAVWTGIPRLYQHFLTLGQTLFSSGVFHWDDDGTLGSDWVVRMSALKLFFSVSLPMMAIIVTAWSLLYIYMRRKRQQEKQFLDKQRTEDNAEKGQLETGGGS